MAVLSSFTAEDQNHAKFIVVVVRTNVNVNMLMFQVVLLSLPKWVIPGIQAFLKGNDILHTGR